MRILVTGGRKDGLEENLVRIALDVIHHNYEIEYLVHGDAIGTDAFADRWANDNGVTRFKCPANWVKYSSSAGSIRNFEMLKIFNIDMVCAFPGGKGTKNMVDLAKSKNILVWEYGKSETKSLDEFIQ